MRYRPRQALVSRPILRRAGDQAHDGLHAAALRGRVPAREARGEVDGRVRGAEHDAPDARAAARERARCVGLLALADNKGGLPPLWLDMIWKRLLR